MYIPGLIFALLAGTVIAIPSTDHVLHERRDFAFDSQMQRRSAPSDRALLLSIALTQRNLEQIPKYLDDVSNPGSSNFGKHWTGDEMMEAFAPAEETVRAVRGWLSDAGLQAQLSPNRHWIHSNTTVAKAEKLLKTRYSIYQTKDDAHERIGCDEYSLPGHIAGHVDFITPTVSLRALKPSPPRKRDNDDNASYRNQQHTNFKPFATDGAEGGLTAAAAVNGTAPPSIATCSNGATPDCIRALYGVPKGSSSVNGNQLGIYESEDYYDQPDLDMFFVQFAPDVKNGTAPILDSIDGGLGDQGSGRVGGEAILDLQCAYPLVYPQNVRLLQTDDPVYFHSNKRGHFDSLLDALDADFCTFMGGDNSTIDFTYPNNQVGGYNGTKMCGAYNPPTVLSISYGYTEVTFSPAYLQRQCLEFAKLSLAGTTVIASSGDSGVSASFCANPNFHVATPQFPASCPFVTTVGATMLNHTADSLDDSNAELVASDRSAEFQSGAGFSTIFPMPDWQKDAANRYLAAYANDNRSIAMIPDVEFNATGRAYPDVVALGTNITTITNAQTFNADGTSASAPIFAALITLINEQRMGGGKRPVGFINPILYKAGADPAIFRDITSGSNGNCGLAGFKALPGWDAASGWGSPKWEGLKELLVNMP